MKFNEDEIKASAKFNKYRDLLKACLPSDFSTGYTLRYKRT